MDAAEITIELAEKTDAAFIRDFNRAMAMETESKELPLDIVTRGVERLIQNPAYGFYVIARDGEKPVGTLMVTTEWSDWRDGLFWWIQSVYITPEYRRRGIYRKMYEFVKQRAALDPDICGFRLYVERENKGAQKTYAALGMHETDYYVYEEELKGNKA